MASKVLLDTNAILRYLLDDNHEQHLQVLETIKTKDCFCILSVIQEAVYVLNGYYAIPREPIKQIFSSLSEVISICDDDVLLKALDFFIETPKLDFIDCILCGYQVCRDYNVFSFDEKLNKKIKRIS
ncbi:MAG: PIN domain-containing protein [Flexilinea sp.]|nr:PIN domain-containing protein [Flexilinea sp.]